MDGKRPRGRPRMGMIDDLKGGIVWGDEKEGGR